MLIQDEDVTRFSACYSHELTVTLWRYFKLAEIPFLMMTDDSSLLNQSICRKIIGVEMLSIS